MTLMKAALPYSLAFCGLLFAGSAAGHGENVDLQINSLGNSLFLGTSGEQVVRIMGPHFGNTQDTLEDRLTVNSPWVNFGPSINPATRQFSMHLEALRVWDGSGFVDPGNETVSIAHSGGTTILGSSAPTSFQLDPVDVEIDWTLESNLVGIEPDRAVYLVELFIREDTAGSTVDDSLHLFLAFDFESGFTPENPSYLSPDYDHSSHMASRQYILNNLLVPEPGSLAILGLGGLALLRRRR